MYPFSYTSLKIIHDEKIQEALEHQPLAEEQEAPQQSLLHTYRMILARFHKQAGRKQEEPLPGCAW